MDLPSNVGEPGVQRACEHELQESLLASMLVPRSTPASGRSMSPSANRSGTFGLKTYGLLARLGSKSFILGYLPQLVA